MSASISSSNPNQSLNQADFLNLLVTQMTSQDPLNPQSDTQFAAQLAQFSSLQESQQTESDLQSIQATGLIGETVTLAPAAGQAATSGVVSGIQISAGTPQIAVNGNLYNLSQIAAITPTFTASATGSSSSSSSASSGTGTQTAGSTSRTTDSP